MSLFVNKNDPMSKSMELLNNKELTYEEAGMFFDFISPEYNVIKKSNYLIIKVPNIKKELCKEKLKHLYPEIEVYNKRIVWNVATNLTNSLNL